MATSLHIDDVSEILRSLAAEAVLPRFRSLEPEEVSEKGPGDLVTIVDREVEESLTGELTGLLPGSRLVGEESVAERPEILHGITSGWVWVVDPLDGTANFVAGREAFAMMVGLLRDGEAVAAWILAPVSGRLAVGESGAGVTLDGEPWTISPQSLEDRPPDMASATYLPRELRRRWREIGLIDRFNGGSGSAGIEYPALIAGRWSTLFYWRTFPWDHVPGTLLVREAGGHVARLDGSRYAAGDGKNGLVVAATAEEWERVRALLAPGLPRS